MNGRITHHKTPKKSLAKTLQNHIAGQLEGEGVAARFLRGLQLFGSREYGVQQRSHGCHEEERDGCAHARSTAPAAEPPWLHVVREED